MNHDHKRCKLLRGPKPDKLQLAVRLTDFVNKLAPNSAAFIVSNPERTRSNDTEYTYRQSSDVLYLNGFPEPEAVLIVTNFGTTPNLVMLVRPKDRQSEIWTGIREGVEGAKKNYFADEAFPIDKFEEVAARVIAQADNVYYKFGRNRHFDRLFRKVWAQRQKPLLNPEKILHEMRLFKRPEELAIMRHAAAISAEAHCEAMKTCRPGLMEYQLQAVLECSFLYHGANGPSYGSIVAGGNNAIVLHYTQNDAELKDGDLVLIDAACEYQGYAADITRTFPVNGKFTKAQREIYEVVLDAQVAAIETAKPGVSLAQVHLTAQRVLCQGLVRLSVLPASCLVGDYLNEHGKGKYSGKNAKLHLLDLFMHGTSHWLGIDVHDVGSYATADGTRTDKGKERILEPGMVITVEPGLYFDAADKRVPKQYRGIGVRIEDDVVITADGNEVITAGVPKTVAAIETLMAGKSLRKRSGRASRPARA